MLTSRRLSVVIKLTLCENCGEEHVIPGRFTSESGLDLPMDYCSECDCAWLRHEDKKPESEEDDKSRPE